MVCLQTTELAAVERRIAEAGVRVVEDLPYEGGRTLHLHPKDVGGAILSVDATLPAWRWPWVGDDRAPPLVEAAGLEIVGLELRSVRPAALARRWAGLVGEGAAAEDSVWRVPLPGCELRFRAAPEEGAGGLCGLVVRALDPDAVRGRAAARGRLGPGGTIRLAGLDVELVSDLPA